MNLLSPKIWSNNFFHVCYHAGGSTKHLRRLKMKRRDEESSPSDASPPKKRKTRLAGKMRTYLWARPLTSQPHLPFPCFCKIKMRGSQVAYCMKKSFLELFARLQSRDINDMSLNPFTWRWQFYWLKKKTQDMFCSRMRAWIFCVKRCTIWMHNVMAQIGLERNSSGDVSLEKEKAPLLQWICWLK